MARVVFSRLTQLVALVTLETIFSNIGNLFRTAVFLKKSLLTVGTIGSRKSFAQSQLSWLLMYKTTLLAAPYQYPIAQPNRMEKRYNTKNSHDILVAFNQCSPTLPGYRSSY